MGPLVINPGGGIPPIDKATVARTGVQMQMPLYIGETTQSLWLLPIEPLIAVRGHNIIANRSVSKLRGAFGSVKEYWAKADYEIIITGLLDDYTNPNKLPTEMISKLNALCSLGKPLAIQSALLDALGIAQIAVFDWDFPPTPGIDDQQFSIRALSDQNFNLLIEK